MRKSQVGSNSENLLNPKSNKRPRDWICVLCNNLNYSFRESCNRCKNVTRQENSNLLKNQQGERNPLGPLSLNKHSSFKEQAHRLQQNHHYFFSSQAHKKYKITEPIIHLTDFNDIDQRKILKFPVRQCLGFSSLLFLTPTRYLRVNEEDDEKQECMDNSSKSPCALSSVSPLLRVLKDEIDSRM